MLLVFNNTLVILVFVNENSSLSFPIGLMPRLVLVVPNELLVILIKVSKTLEKFVNLPYFHLVFGPPFTPLPFF
jgi:hypothetical protein